MKSVALALGAALASAHEGTLDYNDVLLPDYAGMTYQKFLEENPRESANFEEFLDRAAIFSNNLKAIVQHNLHYVAGRETWWMKANKFADWTPKELAALGGKKGYMPGKRSDVLLKKGANPSSKDWRQTPAVVTPVKDHGSCGSCWAFASTETVESAFALSSGGSLLELGPQALVSCMANPDQCGGSGGCQGAIAELSFDFTAEQGLPLASDYAYTGQNTACEQYTAAVVVDGYVKLPENDADALETALANIGPIAVSVAAGQFYLYGGGVFNGCTGATGTEVDHAVQAVGYSQDYWLIRNSWGSRWGEHGYIRISRSKDNVISTDNKPADGVACVPYPDSLPVGGECAILSDSAYPVGARAGASQTVV